MDWQREHSPDVKRPAMPPQGLATRAESIQPDAGRERLWLDHAVNHLRRTHPKLSSAYLLAWWQIAALMILIAGLSIGLAIAPSATLNFLFAAMALPFCCIVAIRALALAHLFVTHPSRETPPPAFAASDPLPYYAILVPLYQEAEVVPGLLAALAAIDYPKDRIEISLIVERDDLATRTALAREQLPAHMRIVSVPDGAPRTKPRAINYALASARGDYVVVYDAEDIPEPDQLRRALAAFQAAGPDLGCVQSCLNTYNPNETFFTRGILAQTHQT